MLKEKTLSILGDSISTYKGISNDASIESTLLYNPYFYKDPFPLEKTYWKLLISSLELKLCVNNSWSGGNLSGQENPDSGVNRANHLSQNNGCSPNLIIVFMGINDLGRGVPAPRFAEDYQKTLTTIKSRYPNASVCCVNLPDRDPSVKKQTELFNDIIQEAVNNMGGSFFVADLFNSPLNNDTYYRNTLDGLHPDEDGMRMIAEVLKGSIERNDRSE